ncbi:MAG: hypothetical protein GY719_28750 [bacterium]|nr:hypothetical protein [bacterium]
MANRNRAERLERARDLLHVEAPDAIDQEESWEERCLRLTGRDPTLCPECHQGRMIRVEMLLPESISLEGIDSS